MDKIVINLYGGPGTGKSTTAAHAFALLKQKGHNAELITEYVKNWVWEGREIKRNDQYYLFAKQARYESSKFDHVDIIVTDAPIWLSSIYEAKNEPTPHICDLLIDKHVSLAQEKGFEHKHVFLKRVKPYKTEGRLETESQAKEIDDEIREYLTRNNMSFMETFADEKAAVRVLTYLGLI